MTIMQGMCLTRDSNGLRLVKADLDRPHPGPEELLIRVSAAGVTPAELAWYPTLHTKSGQLRSRAVPGHEFSGVVAEVGANVKGFGIGDAVYGMNDWFDDGATAEYCLTVEPSVAAKPVKLTHVEAASVPIGALTAWQGLLNRGKLEAGDTVLVQGGAGGVGVFAVQLAKHRGASVTATASQKNFDFVQTLGADEVIDYKTDYFARNAGRFDVVFDVVGGESLARSWALLKPGGRMITIAAVSEQTTEERVKQAFFIVEPKQDQLQTIADLLDSGRLVSVVDAVVGFERASDAYKQNLEGRRGRGKVVIDMAGIGNQ